MHILCYYCVICVADDDKRDVNSVIYARIIINSCITIHTMGLSRVIRFLQYKYIYYIHTTIEVSIAIYVRDTLTARYMYRYLTVLYLARWYNNVWQYLYIPIYSTIEWCVFSASIYTRQLKHYWSELWSTMITVFMFLTSSLPI